MADPLVRAIYQALIGSDNVRLLAQPVAGTVLVQVADDSAWDQLFVAATITTEYWFARVDVSVVTIAADLEERLAVGSGGADGAAVAAATLLAEILVTSGSTSDVGAQGSFLGINLPVPIRIPASTRFAAEITESLVGGQALGVGIGYLTGLGT